MNKNKRNWCMTYAIGYAKRKNLLMAVAWCERASKAAPLNQIQWWKFKREIRETDFEKLDLTRVRVIQ